MDDDLGGSASRLDVLLLSHRPRAPRTRCHTLALATTLIGLGLAICAAAAFVSGTYDSPIFTPVAAVRPDPSVHRGVNLGGWLVIESWVAPSLFFPFLCVGQCPPDTPPVIDERSFCDRLGAEEARRRLDAFRSEWVTEATFARIAASGLNTVRIPYGWWIFGDTPICSGVPSIHHLDNAVDWAEAHGLHVVLDLHGVPPSQNGYDHSGTSSHPPFAHQQPAWARGPFDGGAWLRPENVNLTRSVLRRVASRYAKRSAVVRMGMVNEPLLIPRSWCDSGCPIQMEELVDFYEGTWKELGAIVPSVMPVLDVGLGAGASTWEAALGAAGLPSRLAQGVVDMHIYQAWAPWGIQLFPQAWHLRNAACGAASSIRDFHARVAPVMVGEWSAAMTDCATWINGVGLATGYDALLGINRGACSRVPCPNRFSNLTEGATLSGGPDEAGMCPTGELVDKGGPAGKLGSDAFYALLTEYMVGAYESSAGWTFWNFQNEMHDPRWSFFDAQERGWFPADLSTASYAPRRPDCDSADTVFGSLVTTAAVFAAGVVVTLCGTIALACRTRPCRRLRRRCGCCCCGSRRAKHLDTDESEDAALATPSQLMGGDFGGRALG